MAMDSAQDGDDARIDMGGLWAAIRRRWLRIVLVTVLLLGASYGVLMFVPRSYESTASILVENRQNVYTDPVSASSSGGSQQESADATISSQIELVKSRDTLLPVVRDLGLAKLAEFNGAGGGGLFGRLLHKSSGTANPENIALNTLSDHLLVTRERDSALISVTVRSADPELAAKLANAIAKADVMRRADLSLSDTADASQWLEQQIATMQKRVSAAETKVADFKVKNDLYTGTNSTSLLDQQMTEVSTQITTAQERKDAAQSRAALIRGLLEAGQPIDGVDDVRNSATIQQLTQQRAQLAAQRAQLLATLLPGHPNVAAVTAQITAIDRQIGTEGRRVADALDAEAKIEGNLITSLQSNLDGLKNKVADATRQQVELDALDREAKADRDLLESYMTRYRDAAARTDPNSTLPDVRVVTYAAPPSTPASPKTTLILGAVGFVSLAVQIGSILFGELLSGRALIEPARVETRTEPVAAPAPPELTVEAGAAEAGEPVAREGLRIWFNRRGREVAEVLATHEPPVIAAPPEPVMAAVPAETAVEQEHDETEPDAEAPAEPKADDMERLSNLSADLMLGRARILVVAGVTSVRDSESLAARLISDALRQGLSVARVDAGSGRASASAGISDLAVGEVSYGDVVHETEEEGLAEIPWGRHNLLDLDSSRPVTLIEALSDLYEIVIVLAGRFVPGSAGARFAVLNARLVLAGAAGADPSVVEPALDLATASGWRRVEAIAVPLPEAEVA